MPLSGRQPKVRKTRRYGWSPDLPDRRDFHYSSIMQTPTMPAAVDLRPNCPPVYNQEQLASCTAHAIAAALEFDERPPRFVPSRLFIYYNERVIAGAAGSDGGAHLRDGMRSVSSQGACNENDWPYDVTQPSVPPPPHCYARAREFKAISYYSLDQELAQLRSCLAEGYPFLFGFTAYDSFESPQTKQSGVLDLPADGEGVLGGHAVLAVGYDDASQRVIVRNSWGEDWGQAGYFTMPYAYITDANLARDFWTIRKVS